MPLTKTFIANIRGLQGIQGVQGEQGLPGVNAVPADSAVAGYITTAGNSATKSALLSGYQPQAEVGLLASAHGVAGDGATDDSAALNQLLVDAVAAGVPAVLEPMSTVVVNSTIVPPNGARLNLNGARILSRVPGGNGYTISLVDRSDVEIWGGTIDGDRAWYTAATEWRHGINMDNSKRINLHDLLVTRHKGDGVYVGGTISPTFSADITMTNVVCTDNYRQGLSIIAVDGFTAVSCRFTGTSGTDPQSGVDVEPNHAWQRCTNIRFTACVFSGNTGHGFLVALVNTRTAMQGGITLTGCTFAGNAQAGIRLAEAEDVQVIGGSITGNFTGILHNTVVARDIKVMGVDIRKNSQHGIAITAVFSGFMIQGCTVKENGQTTTGDGLNITPSASSSNFQFIGNYSGQSPQRNGITINANVSGVMLVGNSYGGNTGSNRALTGAATLDLDSAGKRTVTGSRGGNAAVTSLLQELATLGLITNSTTA